MPEEDSGSRVNPFSQGVVTTVVTIPLWGGARTERSPVPAMEVTEDLPPTNLGMETLGGPKHWALMGAVGGEFKSRKPSGKPSREVTICPLLIAIVRACPRTDSYHLFTMTSKRPGFPGLSALFSGSPKGNRTPVNAVRGRRPNR